MGGIAQSLAYWNSPYYQNWRDSERTKQWDDFQNGLSVLGSIEPTGLIDFTNAVMYGLRGQRGNAAIAALAILPFGDIAKGSKLLEKSYSVYHGLDETGAIKYVGITSRNPLVRFAEHQGSIGTGKELLRYEGFASGLTKEQAKVLEQTLINQYGLQKNGGELLNKINSIAEKNWAKYGINK